MKEELGIEIKNFNYVGEFYYEDGNKSQVYLIDQWEGELEAKEAESIIWIEKPEELSNKFDKMILDKILNKSGNR